MSRDQYYDSIIKRHLAKANYYHELVKSGSMQYKTLEEFHKAKINKIKKKKQNTINQPPNLRRVTDSYSSADTQGYTGTTKLT